LMNLADDGTFIRSNTAIVCCGSNGLRSLSVAQAYSPIVRRTTSE
jgi:hypothetical protein